MKTPVRTVSLIVVSVLAGAAIALWVAQAFTNFFSANTDTTRQDTQVINAVTEIEEVALLSLGIQGIVESRANTELFGFEVPGTGRTSFIKYTYQAKLGIDGSAVTITPTGENSYVVGIPEFIVIGTNDVDFSTAVEVNGVLSWVTAEIDELEIVNEALNPANQQAQIDQQRDLLEEQAEFFYGTIIRNVDPEIELEFEFAG